MAIASVHERFAHAAESFTGCPFKLYGRDPKTGLDCIGLVGASLKKIGRSPSLPVGYALRNAAIEHWLKHSALSGFEKASHPIMAGDLLLTIPGPGQHHLAIALNARCIVHAHAGLRRVVCQPLDANARCLAHWRLSTQT